MDHNKSSPKIKICGLTRAEEASYLNEAGADYAGFVFFVKSKRNVTIEQAQKIRKKLNPEIKTVAVTVSPDIALVEEIVKVGFHILQVHKELSEEVLAACTIPIWYAFNVSDEREVEEKRQFFERLPKHLSIKIAAIVVDGASFGSGKTFDWSGGWLSADARSASVMFKNRQFILAGGLRPENVAEGIRIFAPDIVDVSSGVEGGCGKDNELVASFARAARAAEISSSI